MKKIVILWFFVSINALFLHADLINNSTLEVHATILPKTALMNYDISNRLKNDKMVIALFYNDKYEKSAAEKLKHFLLNKYREGIKSLQIEVHLFSYSSLKEKYPEATVYYLFPSTKQEIKQAVSAAKNVNALTFSYDPNDLKYGVMLSLRIAKKIQPVVNISVLQREKVSFRPILLKVAEKYYQPSVLNRLNDKYTFRRV